MLLQVSYFENDIDKESLKKTFNELSCDPYVKEGFRYKNIIRVIHRNGDIIETEHGPLYQSGVINPTHGDLIRMYPKLVMTDSIKKIIKYFIQESRIKDGEEILVQAQRITTSQEIQGQPAIEGFHRDGVNILGVFCVARENIEGGINQFKMSNTNTIYSEMLLKPGHMVVVDDTRNFHYATPIVQIDNMKPSYRDVILFGTPACRIPDLN